MSELTPEQQVLAQQLLDLVRDERYSFIYVESPDAVYGTPWDVSDDDWEEIEGFDLGSEENVRAIVNFALLPLTTNEKPIYYGDQPMAASTGVEVWISVPREGREPISAELLVFWQRGSGGHIPRSTHVHITKREDGWEAK